MFVLLSLEALFFLNCYFIDKIDKISQFKLENIVEEKEVLIVHPAYKKNVEAAKKILEGNKDIPEQFEKTWTVLLDNNYEKIEDIILSNN